MQKNAVIIIAGPTASGKSRLAFDIAKKLNGVIINADSMQIYKDIPILAATPGAEEKKQIPHKLYEVFESSKNSSVVDWLNLAEVEIKNIWKENKIPVIVGGTGLYIDNLINGTTPIPEVSEEVKEKVRKILEQGLDKAYDTLKKADKTYSEKVKLGDTTRIRRALEVFYNTGITMSKWYEKPMIKKIPEAEFFVIKIIPPAEELDKRIYERFDNMINLGALDEVKKLEAKKLNKNLPAMKALGVPEILSFFEGKTELKKAVDLAKLHSRQYAKRQRTWFNNKLKADIEIKSIYNGTEKMLKNVINYCLKFIKDIKNI